MKPAAPPPLLPPEQAGKLLDELVYDRVLDCIDLDTLLTFECELACAFDECTREGHARGCDLAKEMIDRALDRARDQRWEAHLRNSVPFTEPWGCEDSDNCELCNEVASAPKRNERASS